MAGLLALGFTTLGCHVFPSGLAPRAASGYASPDATVPDPDAAPATDAPPPDAEETLRGFSWNVGCSDGTREGFRDTNRWPSIAGCAGGWQRAGLPVSGAPPKPCAGLSGNNSNPNGVWCLRSGTCIECGVADLCAPTWHPCIDGKEVMKLSSTGCEEILPPGEEGFFIAIAGASADGVCASGERNDLHGCGNLGSPETPQCPPFTRRMGFADCQNTGGVWNCGNYTQSLDEADLVTKPNPNMGGVLCCKD